MASFFEFYHHMKQTKMNDAFNEAVDSLCNILLEMPMRPEGSPDQYGSAANPHLVDRAADGYGSRAAKDGRVTDAGKKISSAVRQANWDAAVAANPTLGVYAQMGDELSDERKAHSKETAALHQQVTRKGGGVVQDGPKERGEGDFESIFSGNRISPAIQQIVGGWKELQKMKNDGMGLSHPLFKRIFDQLMKSTDHFLKKSNVVGGARKEIEEIQNQLYQLAFDAESGEDSDIW